VMCSLSAALIFDACGRCLTSRNHRPLGPSPRIKNLIIINRRIQLITECNMHSIFIFARSPQLEM
jgi:hypothetical protein